MNIEKGYNGKILEIRISGRRNTNAELWLKQHGLPDRETLSYVSLQELADLKKEIEDAILEITGIKREY